MELRRERRPRRMLSRILLVVDQPVKSHWTNLEKYQRHCIALFLRRGGGGAWGFTVLRYWAFFRVSVKYGNGRRTAENKKINK